MDETHGIEPVDSKPARTFARPARPSLEVALCVLGSLLSVQLAGIGTFAMVYGAWLLFRPEEQRGLWAIAGCLVPGIALSIVSFVDFGSLVLPCAVIALAIAYVLPGRITVTNVCLTVAALAAMMAGADALFAASVGMDLPGYANALLDEAYEITVSSVSTTSSQLAAEAGIDGVYETMRMVWPLGYVAQASVVVLLGLLGLVVARKNTYAQVYAAFLRYDIPLWGVVALIAGLVCLLLGTTTEQGTQLEPIGLMLLLVLRVLFCLQGLAVLSAWMNRRGMGFASRVIAIALALLAELSLFVVCILGVVDVWANFRKLPRKDVVASKAA